MLKKTVNYTNFDGEEVSEVLYFNLTKAELMELEMSYEGGFSNYIKKIVDSKDAQALVTVFKDLIVKSYGVRSENGKSIIKNEKLREEFLGSEAYSELFMELISDQKAGEAFFNAVVPKVDTTKNFIENK